MSNLPTALFRGARGMVALAREVERDATLFDRDWAERSIEKAAEYRKQARWYLMRRKQILRDREETDPDTHH